MGIGRFFKADVQTVTWYQHSFFAVTSPGFLGVGVSAFYSVGWGLLAAMLTSWFVGLFFLYREEQHENKHKQVGDWTTPDEEGITPLVDDYGDLVGPVTAAFCYTVAMLIYLAAL